MSKFKQAIMLNANDWTLLIILYSYLLFHIYDTDFYNTLDLIWTAKISRRQKKALQNGDKQSKEVKDMKCGTAGHRALH